MIIDIKSTILQTIKNQFEKLRKLAVNDTHAFKKIINLIMLDDMYDWGVYLGVDECTLQRLAEIKKQFIFCNPIFSIQNTVVEHSYVNVNTPQNGDTWKRVWDSPNVTIVTNPGEPIVATSIPVCNRAQKLHFITLTEEGVPNVNITTLTDCEKMDIYIDKESGKMFYLDCESNAWKLIDPSGMTEQDVKAILDKNRPGVDSSILGTTIITQLTANKTDTSTVDTVTDSDVEDWL